MKPDPYLQLKIIALKAELFQCAKTCRILGKLLLAAGAESNPSACERFFKHYARVERLQLQLKALGVNEEYTKI